MDPIPQRRVDKRIFRRGVRIIMIRVGMIPSASVDHYRRVGRGGDERKEAKNPDVLFKSFRSTSEQFFKSFTIGSLNLHYLLSVH